MGVPSIDEQHLVGGQEHVRVVANPGEKIPSPGGLLGGAMGGGQALCVLLQALDAEELGADRFFLNLQFEPPFRDTERAFPIPGPGRYGRQSRLGCGPATSRALAGMRLIVLSA